MTNISCGNKKMWSQVSCVQDPTTEWPRFRPHVHLFTMINWVQTVLDAQKCYTRWSILLSGVNKTNKTSRWFRNVFWMWHLTESEKQFKTIHKHGMNPTTSTFLTPVDPHCHDLSVLTSCFNLSKTFLASPGTHRFSVLVRTMLQLHQDHRASFIWFY